MHLAKSLALILAIAIHSLFAATALAHKSNTPRGVHTVIGALYNTNINRIHGRIAHDYNNFKNLPREFRGKPGYIGGHSGYDVYYISDDKAKFYSLTNGVVLRRRMPENPEVDLSYLAVYNEDDNKVIFYVHLSHIKVKRDEKVDVGEYLGKQGWNSKWSERYHIHLEVRHVINKNNLPRSPSRGASPVFNNPNIEPIKYLHGELLEDAGNNPIVAAPPKPPKITQTWANLKSED